MTSPTDPIAEAPEGIALLGAEMLSWADYGSSVPPADGGALRGLLLAAAASARSVLFLGPHDAALVAEVARVCPRTEIVLRSLPDAELVHAAVGGGVGISAGAFDAFAGSGHDLVVALDGLGRLLSAEEPPLSWHDLLDRVLALPGAGGRVLLATGNEAGLDRLLALAPAESDDDAHWPSGRTVEEQVPLGFEELSAALAARDGWGFSPWACFGPRTSPSVAAPVATVGLLRHDPRFGALLERAAWEGSEGAPPVRDPARLARTLLRHGQGVDLAPLWVFDGRRGAAEETPADEVLWLDRQVGEPGVAVRIEVTGDRWLRNPTGPAEVSPVGEAVERDPAALAGEVPAGALVSELLAGAVAAQDLDAAGRLLRRYHDWLAADATTAEDAAGAGRAPRLTAAGKAAVTLDNLLDTGSGLVPFDPSLQALVPAPVDDVFARTLLVFAGDLIATGHRHPWPAGHDAHRIAAALAASAGVRIEETDRPRVEELDRLLRVERASGGLAQLSHTEALAAVERYRAALEQSEQQLEWLVLNIHYRQRALVRSQARLRKLQESAQYRTGQRVLWMRERAKKLRGSWLSRGTTPVGEWREPQEGVEREPVEVEAELLPPGYETKGPTI
jgi:hypothetical protein